MTVPVKLRTATINWHGVTFRGQEVRPLSDGNWLLTALEKHPRVDIGHQFAATTTEITWDD